MPVAKVRDFELRFYEFMDSTHPEVGRAILEKGSLGDDTREPLIKALRGGSKAEKHTA